jgi:NAD(P)-dependent dehydrogenase (short-subunit alcohol dehydrogenase family)
MRAVLPAMFGRGAGSIVAQSSTAGLVRVGGVAPYWAAKGGVIAPTRQLAGRARPSGHPGKRDLPWDALDAGHRADVR